LNKPGEFGGEVSGPVRFAVEVRKYMISGETRIGCTGESREKA